MPLPPLGTKNWTIDDYIRYIDQYGDGVQKGNDECALPVEGYFRGTPTSIRWAQQIDPEYCPYCGNQIHNIESECPQCGYCAL